jgi:predicted ester cyclase
MSTPINEALVRRYFEEALSHADWDALDALVAADYVDHEAVPNIPLTRDGLKQKYELLRGGCPDLRFVIEDLVSASDRVAARFSLAVPNRQRQIISSTHKIISLHQIEINSQYPIDIFKLP